MLCFPGDLSNKISVTTKVNSEAATSTYSGASGKTNTNTVKFEEENDEGESTQPKNENKPGSSANSNGSEANSKGAADDIGVQAGSSADTTDDMGIKAGGDADIGSTGGAAGAEEANTGNETSTGNETNTGNETGSAENGGGKNETGDEKPGGDKDGKGDKGKEDKESGKGAEEKDPSSKSTQGYSKSGVEAHNIFRKIHEAPDMKNNEKMAQEAEAYAKELAKDFKFEHSKSKDGENLAMSCNSKKGSELSAADATKMWYVFLTY